MPALVTCRGTSLETQWNVGSDDFVVPAIVILVLSLFSSILVMAALGALYVAPECPNDSGLPPILYCSFFILLTVEIATAFVETVIMSISCRGRIWETEKRDPHILKYIYFSLVLLVLEFIAVILCSVASFDQSVIGQLDCNSYAVAVALLQTSSVVVLLKFTGSIIKLLVFLDPCGLFTPGLLQHLSFLDSADDHGEMPAPLEEPQTLPLFSILQNPATYSPTARPPLERSGSNVVRFWRQSSIAHAVHGGYTLDEISQQAARFRSNHIGLRRLQRRLRIMLCCLGVGGQRSRGVALEDVARALYTLFDFEEEENEEENEEERVNLVLSDVIAGFKLVNIYQRNKTKRLGEGERLEDKFRMVTFNRMPVNQKPHYVYKPPRPFLIDKPECHLLVDDMIQYMRHSMGMYGWPLHVFSNMACGLCQLASRTCCKSGCVQPGVSSGGEKKSKEERNCCMCGVAAMTLQTGVEQEDVLYISMDNEIYKAPFAVVLDKKMESVVVSVRGTLSIKDALTDMSYSMQFVEIAGVHETFVHKGMYAAADEIRQRLLGRTRQEVRLEAIRTQGRVSETEVDTMMERERRILPEIFQEHKDYQLIVTGHSLGAGVASVLALLLRKDFPDLHCYAFSPPGCVFSYPLAKYSRKFTTSVVLGNDVVPRLSFRSLLYLKQSVKHLLQRCQKPKFDVLFLPKWCSRRVRTSDDTPAMSRQPTATSLPEGFEDLIVGENTTVESLQNAVFPVTHVHIHNPCPNTSSRQVSMDLLDNPQAFDRKITSHVQNTCGRFMPTFPPGKIFHLKVNQNTSLCCLGCCYPNQLEMERVRNEDLCMIMIDSGAVEDHLPNHVLGSLERFKRQSLAEHYQRSEVERLREKAKRERQEKREARALSSAGGGWVFPTGSRDGHRTYSTQTTTSSSLVTSTPDIIAMETDRTTDEATPTNVNGTSFAGAVNRLSAIPEDSVSLSDYTRDLEVEDALDARETEVELYDECNFPPEDFSTEQILWTRRDQTNALSLDIAEVGRQVSVDENEVYDDSVVEPSTPNAEKDGVIDTLDQQQVSVVPKAVDLANAKKASSIHLTKRDSRLQLLSAKLDTLFEDEPASDSPSRRSFSENLRRISRRRVSSGERLVTVKSRRGKTLKLIIPQPSLGAEETVTPL